MATLLVLPLATYPDCVDVSADARKQQLARLRVCTSAHILNRSRPTSIVWSQPLVQSRRLFVNEKPFPASKFERFSAQLPETGNLDTLVSNERGCRSPRAARAADGQRPEATAAAGAAA